MADPEQQQQGIIASTNYLKELASICNEDEECFYFRGIVPASWGIPDVPPPPEELRLEASGQYQFDGWQPSVYFTDGAGGAFGQYPQLRRCALAVAALTWQLDVLAIPARASAASILDEG